MARLDRRKVLTALLLLLMVVNGGCSPSSFYFFLPENKTSPEMHQLAAKDKKKEVRVVILTYSNKLETRAELIGADRDISQQLATRLREGCAANDENVVIVNPRKVEEFKSAHPSWTQADLSEIGRHFKADYVVYLEINKLSFFDKADMHQLYKGRIDISISLVDVNNPDGTPERKEFNCSYPSEAKAIQVDEMPTSRFREEFFAYVVKKISWYFTAHLPRDGYNDI